MSDNKKKSSQGKYRRKNYKNNEKTHKNTPYL